MSVTIVKGISQAYKNLVYKTNEGKAPAKLSLAAAGRDAAVINIRSKETSYEKIRTPKEAKEKAEEVKKEIKKSPESALSAHTFQQISSDISKAL